MKCLWAAGLLGTNGSVLRKQYKHRRCNVISWISLGLSHDTWSSFFSVQQAHVFCFTFSTVWLHLLALNVSSTLHGSNLLYFGLIIGHKETFLHSVNIMLYNKIYLYVKYLIWNNVKLHFDFTFCQSKAMMFLPVKINDNIILTTMQQMLCICKILQSVHISVKMWSCWI